MPIQQRDLRQQPGIRALLHLSVDVWNPDVVGCDVRLTCRASEGLVLERQRVEGLIGMRLKRHDSRRNGEQGFTILEAIIAGFVFTFRLLSIAALFATAVGNNGRSRVDTPATMLSQSIIEQITAVLARGG